MLRLFRFIDMKVTLSPSIHGTKARPSSPLGDSIFITSAPKSASIMVQVGPAAICVKSMTLSPLRDCESIFLCSEKK